MDSLREQLQERIKKLNAQVAEHEREIKVLKEQKILYEETLEIETSMVRGEYTEEKAKTEGKAVLTGSLVQGHLVEAIKKGRRLDFKELKSELEKLYVSPPDKNRNIVFGSLITMIKSGKLARDSNNKFFLRDDVESVVKSFNEAKRVGGKSDAKD